MASMASVSVSTATSKPAFTSDPALTPAIINRLKYKEAIKEACIAMKDDGKVAYFPEFNAWTSSLLNQIFKEYMQTCKLEIFLSTEARFYLMFLIIRYVGDIHLIDFKNVKSSFIFIKQLFENETYRGTPYFARSVINAVVSHQDELDHMTIPLIDSRRLFDKLHNYFRTAEDRNILSYLIEYMGKYLQLLMHRIIKDNKENHHPVLSVADLKRIILGIEDKRNNPIGDILDDAEVYAKCMLEVHTKFQQPTMRPLTFVFTMSQDDPSPI